MILRPYTPADNHHMVALFYGTVHTVNAADYTPRQLDAWAPAGLDANEWCKAFAHHHTVVAEAGGEIVGFADVHDNGYFDHLFVHKDHQGQGVGTALAEAVEAYAKASGIPEVYAKVSITARPFFEKRGYTVAQQLTTERRGQAFVNYDMRKAL